jgi:biopolymer transport protein ExbD
MKKRGLSPMHSEHVNVTPLIDVVMCLIVFFLICGRLAKDEVVAEQLKVPVAKLGQEITEQRDRVVINIVPDMPNPQELEGDLKKLDPNKPDDLKTLMTMAGRRAPKIYVRGHELTEAGLMDLLKSERDANRDLKVMVRADAAQNYEFVAPVLVCCAKANIHSVNLSTTKTE